MPPTSFPSQSGWIQDVLRRIEYRTGYDTQANHAVPMEALATLLENIKKDAKECRDRLAANKLWKIGAFICMVTSASLWGYKGFYTDLAGLKTHLDKGKNGGNPSGSHTQINSRGEGGG